MLGARPQTGPTEEGNVTSVRRCSEAGLHEAWLYRVGPPLAGATAALLYHNMLEEK